MDSFVVRIYRIKSDSPQDLVGLVELVDCDKEKAFSSFDELRAILNSRQGETVRKEVKEYGKPS